MRYSIFFLLSFVFLFSYQPAISQNLEFVCDMPELSEGPFEGFNYEGLYITSSGTLKVIVIFVRFADDNETSVIWPTNPGTLPAWAQNFVNTTYSSTGNYYSETVSKYFYQNSYGNLHVIGDVKYVTTTYNESYYHQYAESNSASDVRALIEMEVLDKLDSPPYNVDFSIYDNWIQSAYNNEPGQDDKVDMIWFMTRNLHDDNLPTGQAPFGIGWALLDCGTHQRDGVSIVGGFPGSGIGMFAPHLYSAVNPAGTKWCCNNCKSCCSRDVPLFLWFWSLCRCT